MAQSPTEGAIITALSRHASELKEWGALAKMHPRLKGAPYSPGAPLPWLKRAGQQGSRETHDGGRSGGDGERTDGADGADGANGADGPDGPDKRAVAWAPDALAFDYGPSFNFRTDCFEFDRELKRVHRATPFAAHLHVHAREALQAMMGDEPFLAVHLRRDGYQHYCAGSGLQHYGGQRYGVAVRATAAAAALHAPRAVRKRPPRSQTPFAPCDARARRRHVAGE